MCQRANRGPERGVKATKAAKGGDEEEEGGGGEGAESVSRAEKPSRESGQGEKPTVGDTFTSDVFIFRIGQYANLAVTSHVAQSCCTCALNNLTCLSFRHPTLTTTRLCQRAMSLLYKRSSAAEVGTVKLALRGFGF